MNENKRYQVLLVDDDLLVIDDLKDMIDWEKEGFQIAAVAGNGEEALQIIKQKEIDLMIVDIEMPVLNGLDFLRQLQKENINMCSLLLTAYSRFDYAREALSLGVYNYILKYELTPQLLLDNLNQMKKESALIKEKGKLNQHFQIQNYLQGNASSSLETIMSLKKEENQIILFHIIAALPLNDLLSHAATEQLEQKNYQNESIELKDINASTLIYSVNEKEVYLLVACAWNDTGLSYSQLEHILEAFRSYWKNDCFVISSLPCSFTQLSHLYHSMNQLNQYFYLPLNHCCEFQKIYRNKSLIYEDWSEIFNGFSFDQPSEAIEQMKAYLTLLEQYQPPLHEILLNLQDLIHQLQRYFQKNDKEFLQEDLKKWMSICNYEQFKQFISNIIFKLEQLQNQKYSRKVLEMMNYLQQHCEQEDVLENLSVSMSMNREYMSKIFKKETGQSLSQRLQEIRMKKAYQLLSTTHLKIYEIAEQCGYNSSQYFSSVFTKYYQCSPSDVMNKGENYETEK